MGSRIDALMAPKMSILSRETEPKRRLATIASLKQEMRTVYNEVVVDSDEYRAHLFWVKALGLRSRFIDVRPTLQEFYIYKERRTGRKLRNLMKEREKIRTRAYTQALPDMDRARLAYPEEFDSSWLKEMGKLLGYPLCCINAYASDREAGINVEFRAAEQLKEIDLTTKVDSLTYFIGYFFPCKPDCEAANKKGQESLRHLIEFNSSLGEIYVSLTKDNLENVLRQPELIASYRKKAEERVSTR